jgi:hypothetical protein
MLRSTALYPSQQLVMVQGLVIRYITTVLCVYVTAESKNLCTAGSATAPLQEACVAPAVPAGPAGPNQHLLQPSRASSSSSGAVTTQLGGGAAAAAAKADGPAADCKAQ